MKLLFDQNLSHRLAERLADLFPGSRQARLVGLDRASDAELWDHAARERHAIVSCDADLAEIATLRGPPPLVIWLRSGNSATTAVEAVLRRPYEETVAATADDVRSAARRGVVTRGRPPLRPRARAAASPSRTPWRITLRSISTKAAWVWRNVRSAGGRPSRRPPRAPGRRRR